jgi:hypothetical protein
MTQTLNAHMNKRKKKETARRLLMLGKNKCERKWSFNVHEIKNLLWYLLEKKKKLLQEWGEGGQKRAVEGLTSIYLKHYKNFCKCHHVHAAQQ